MAAGWPPCLRVLAATVLLIKEVDKLTLGQRLNAKVPHAAMSLTSTQGYHFLSNSRLTQYQGYENSWVAPITVRTLNLATFLPMEEGEPNHDCSEIVDEVHASHLDLQDQVKISPEITLFSDGSSYLQEGSRRARYVVTTTTEVLEAKALTEGWSAQWAELDALTRALILSKGKRVTIYADCRYAFTTVHVHGAICKERGLLTADRKSVV